MDVITNTASSVTNAANSVSTSSNAVSTSFDSVLTSVQTGVDSLLNFTKAGLISTIAVIMVMVTILIIMLLMLFVLYFNTMPISPALPFLIKLVGFIGLPGLLFFPMLYISQLVISTLKVVVKIVKNVIADRETSNDEFNKYISETLETIPYQTFIILTLAWLFSCIFFKFLDVMVRGKVKVKN